MKTIATLLFTTTLMWFASNAWSHTDELLDKATSAHGGQTRMAGPYHLEVVVNKDNVDLYVTDHAGTEKDVRHASATATALAGKGLTKLTFVYVSGNQLRASNALSRDEKLQIVVQFKMANETVQQAKFTPFKKIVSEHQHDGDEHHDHSHQTTDHQH